MKNTCEWAAARDFVQTEEPVVGADKVAWLVQKDSNDVALWGAQVNLWTELQGQPQYRRASVLRSQPRAAGRGGQVREEVAFQLTVIRFVR